MINFVVANHAVLDNSHDNVLNCVIQNMSYGPVLWVEDIDNLHKIVDWAESFYPRRLLLTKIVEESGSLNLASVNITKADYLFKATEDTTIISRSVFIPMDIKYRLLIHFVDDYREKNREYYRLYQNNQKAIQTKNI